MKRLISVATLIAALCLPAFPQGSAGPSNTNAASYSLFSAAFAQPYLTWNSTGLTLTYSSGTLANASSTATQAITSGTVTATDNTTNYIYWTGTGAALSITTTAGTAQAAAWLYTCTAASGSITNCLPVTAMTKTQGTVTVYGAQTFTADCAGALSTAETDYIFPFGGNALECAGVTAATTGAPMTSAGTLQKLYVKAGTAGHGASSGVVTILKGGASTGITCTVGTSTTCSDTAHTAVVAAGDLITATVTGIASETLADIHVSFEKD